MIDTQFLETAVRAARAAAAVLEEWAEKFTVSEKSPANLVTEADFASQQTIHEIVTSKFPDHGFMGEEDAHPDTRGDSGYRWIVDPLDGTSNYVHRFPYYAVSIGLEYDNEMIVGVILDPNRDELFTAVKGDGAFLNGKPIQTSNTESLADALVVASLPVQVSPDHFTVRQFLAMLSAAQHLQRTGSAALNLCYVACGRIEAFFSSSLKPWDIAAGVLIVQEAGGRTSKMNGDTLDLFVPDLVSSNGTGVHDQLRDVCNVAVNGPSR